ncbi:MAG TPA: hypothetical protein VKK79_18005 [Candidatus Lokiarchaeia archaeon]|nr:hypothetical protein [Candidatus Lokiarchaeia archaeon]
MNGEIVVININDVGENMDLEKVRELIAPISAVPIEENVLGKNTPADIVLPTSIRAETDQISFPDNDAFPQITINVRFFEMGVVALICQITCHNADWETIYRSYPNGIPIPEGETSLFNWLEKRFLQILERVQPAISDKIFNNHPKYEQYTILCISDIDVHPTIDDFITTHRLDIAGFLIWDPNPERLHESQIQDALKDSFAYTTSDYAIFDYDRAVVIDLNRDYMDIIFICELANLELLELRTLDVLLDSALEKAEIDINRIYTPSLMRGGNWEQKIRQLAQYRTSLVWISEEISNASKFIGDFFLGQIYEHITRMYELNRWQDSVKRKMQFIQELYQKAQADRQERRLYRLELLMTYLFIAEVVIVILQYLMPHP